MATKTAKLQEKTTPAAEEELKKQEPENTTGTEGAQEGTEGSEGTVTTPELGTEKEPETEPKDEEKVLLAQTYILYNSHQYKPGDELPGNNPVMLAAWLEAGTAAWVSVSELISDTAVPVSVLAGLYGAAVSSDSDNGENLVGRVPINAGRRRK